MMNVEEEFPENSDSNDEDYIPSQQVEVVSEIDSDEDLNDLSENEGVDDKRKRTKMGKIQKNKQKKMKKDPMELIEPLNTQKQLTDEEKKKVEDDIWADFMRDTGFQSRKKSCVDTPTNKINSICVEASSNNNLNSVKKPTEKVKVTQVFEFAGEEVSIEKEVSADSAEARLLNKSMTPECTRGSNMRSKGLSGIGSVLNQLSKKPKISTLEKSKLDWDKFKKEENIEEELQTYNKGRDGYLERQDFLQRADLRRFEIEKEIRTLERNKRINNSL